MEGGILTYQGVSKACLLVNQNNCEFHEICESWSANKDCALCCRVGTEEAVIRIGEGRISTPACKREQEAYRQMEALQGLCIPEVIAEGTLETGQPYIAITYIQANHHSPTPLQTCPSTLENVEWFPGSWYCLWSGIEDCIFCSLGIHLKSSPIFQAATLSNLQSAICDKAR